MGGKDLLAKHKYLTPILRPIYLHTTKYIYVLFCLVIMWLRRKISQLVSLLHTYNIITQ